MGAARAADIFRYFCLDEREKPLQQCIRTVVER
jgi:hypothetical protein